MKKYPCRTYACLTSCFVRKCHGFSDLGSSVRRNLSKARETKNTTFHEFAFCRGSALTWQAEYHLNLSLRGRLQAGADWEGFGRGITSRKARSGSARDLQRFHHAICGPKLKRVRVDRRSRPIKSIQMAMPFIPLPSRSIFAAVRWRRLAIPTETWGCWNGRPLERARASRCSSTIITQRENGAMIATLASDNSTRHSMRPMRRAGRASI